MPFEKGQSGNPSGRPRKTDKYGRAIARAEKKIADRLPELIDNMFVLASGGYARVEEQWAPAGSLWVGSGDSLRRMYPEKELDELVLVRRTASIADRDRQANEYLINRIMGKPIERQEIGGADGGVIEVAFVNYRDGLAGPEIGPGEDSDPPGED
jgi:hypothetical protein